MSPAETLDGIAKLLTDAGFSPERAESDPAGCIDELRHQAAMQAWLVSVALAPDDHCWHPSDGGQAAARSFLDAGQHVIHGGKP